MKTKIYLPLLAIAAVAFAGCDENSWNDKLDGFDPDSKFTSVHKNVELTLTDADYSAIASNATNKALAASRGDEQALTAVGNNKYFNDKILASDYVPAFLAATSPYAYYTDGSSIQLTYKVAGSLPEEVTAAASATATVIPAEYYEQVWDSEDNFITAFAPEKPAARNIPGYLAQTFTTPEANQYVVVKYNEADQNPIFGNVGGGDSDEFVMTDVIASLAPDEAAVIDGVVAGSCTCGFILTDKSGAIFVYMGSGFDVTTYPVGTRLHLDGDVTSFKNNLQIATGAEIEVLGSQEYTFPQPVTFDGAYLDAALGRPANVTSIYGTMAGTIKVSGNNINIVVDGAETAMGSVYYATDEQRDLLVDGAKVTINGWFISISGTRYCNILINELTVGGAASPAKVAFRAPVAPVPFVEKNAIYCYNGSSWSVPANFVILQPADYVAMGKANSISSPNTLLPIYLKQNYPYAQADDFKYVVYTRNGSDYSCDYYIYNGSEWTLNTGIETKTSQFVMAGGKWIFDPNVTIDLPYGKGQSESAIFYQACVDWVYENKCVPLGDTSIKSGKFWVTSYGNNDYYCGTSAYQNNVDLRAASARAQYSEGWEGYTDEEIIATLEERCDQEVFPAVLAQFYPDATPIDGIETVYTINFYAYAFVNESYRTLPCQAKYLLSAKGEFTYIESEWLIQK